MGYYPNDCEVLIPDHVCSSCITFEKGKIRSAAFISEDFVFADDDATNADEWARGINEGNIIMIPKTHGEVAEPTEQTGPGYGDASETLFGYEFTATFYDPNYAENCEFYNAIKKSNKYKLAYRTSTLTHITNVPVSVKPRPVIADDDNSVVDWKVECKWKDDDHACPIEVPMEVFTCYIPEA